MFSCEIFKNIALQNTSGRLFLKGRVLQDQIPEFSISNIININKKLFVLEAGFNLITEAVSRRSSGKKVFLNILQNSQENSRVRVWILRDF